MVSEMSIPAVDRVAMSGLWVHARLLSITASASSGSLQAEPTAGDDAAIHRVRLSRLHESRHYRQASAPGIHPANLPLGLVGISDFFLGIPQHDLVPLRVLAGAPDVILRP